MLNDALGSERRSLDRRPLRTPATLLLGGGQTADVRALDISATTLNVVTAVSPRIGLKFGVRLTIPQRPSGQVVFETPVQVSHMVFAADENGCKVGLRFTGVDATSTATIRNYLAGR
jgi:hypothetical protein